MKFIKLTGRTDSPIYVNAEQICGINETIKGDIRESVVNFSATCVFVKENQDEIMKLIEGVK